MNGTSVFGSWMLLHLSTEHLSLVNHFLDDAPTAKDFAYRYR